MLWIELGILIACIVVGARLGGIALGAVAGIGLVIFVFAFQMPPGSPPTVVLGMIIAVITALAGVQAAGGLDYLVLVAERVMRRRPQYITFVAPLVTYVLIAASGTQHVIYALLPVIAEVSRKAGVRPERPMSISVIAAQQGLVASPVSAATVALLAVLGGSNIGLPQIAMVVMPSTLLAVILGAISVAWRGKPLEADPGYQERLASGKVKPSEALPAITGKALLRARGSTALFLAAIAFVVVLGIFPGLKPQPIIKGEPQEINTAAIIMIVMLAVAGLCMIFFKASAEAAVKGSIMKGGVTAFVSILGVSWLGSSLFEGNRTALVAGISGLIQQAPWVFALGLFVLSILLMSQAATVVTLMPVGVALGLSPWLLVGLYPAVNGYFFLPTYGTTLAAVSFDQTGTTRIGKWLVNHSFMIPGLVATATATLAAVGLSSVLLK
ncbi:MAG TPA: anaerobic C4-dicarboxylate transporter family protein [Anaeromyxobacteraceae bacterium]|nr:anaerobic C4-dicarboxylate transporter family protein [Anaeromyxobacteraceae bacterium]